MSNDLNLDKLKDHLFVLAKQLLNGEKIETIRYRVTLEVPAPIAIALEEAAEGLDVSLEETLSKLASEGLTSRMKELVNKADTKTVPLQEAELPDAANYLKDKLGFDFTKVLSGVENIKQIIPQLTELQKVFEHGPSTVETEIPEPPIPCSGARIHSKDKKDSK